MQNLRHDIAYALRQMRLSPVFTLTALLTLAIGIGATTAIFSLINTVMLQTLPVSDPGTLYRVGSGSDCCIEGGPQEHWGMFSYAFYQQLQKNTPEFQQLAAFQAGGMVMSVRRSEAERLAKPLRGEYVSGNYFFTLGIGPALGRTLTPSDDEDGAAPAAMMSYRTWQQQYGSDPKVVGTVFIIDGRPITIVGIGPRGFFGETLRSDPPDLWVPLHQEPCLAAPIPVAPHLFRVAASNRPGRSRASR